ncbi:hypothetical protein B296_00046454 [Ensete ventricosum]|uniref:Uncharacterized protein n=1 Tax=Ensete ventricosum TaxID=4639 RepID=A0A426XNY4_ENSVE|nr:hypothetical protein B296_00046454 [Ensete ventricosum]
MTLGTCGRIRGSATGETGCRRLTFASFRTGSYITRSITCLETGNRRWELWAPLALTILHPIIVQITWRRRPHPLGFRSISTTTTIVKWFCRAAIHMPEHHGPASSLILDTNSDAVRRQQLSSSS